MSGERVEFRSALASLLNRHSMENMSNTPDFVLAKFLQGCLDALDTAVEERDRWYGIAPKPGWGGAKPADKVFVYNCNVCGDRGITSDAIEDHMTGHHGISGGWEKP